MFWSLPTGEFASSRNLTERKIAIVVPTGATKWSRVRLHLERIAAVVNAAGPGSYSEVVIPFDLGRHKA
jgi:hypothetical protein